MSRLPEERCGCACDSRAIAAVMVLAFLFIGVLWLVAIVHHVLLGSTGHSSLTTTATGSAVRRPSTG